MKEQVNKPAGPTPLGFVSLGCPKNQIDTEIMMGYLEPAGFSFVTDPADAEVIVVNTCGFIDSSKEESVQTILEMAEYKNSGKCKRLVIAGCLAHRYQENLTEGFPEIDAIINLDQLKDIIAACKPGFESGTTDPPKASILYTAEDLRFSTSAPFSRYMKIAEGCDHKCSFCSIPTFRGALRSRTIEDILVEAKALIAEGAVEICLVAQDLGAYGKDLGSENLADLLKAVAALEGLQWLRLHYIYPNGLSKEIQKIIAAEDTIIPYLDIPFQHGSPAVLKDMLRPGTKDGMLKKIKELRANIPDLALRTSIIVGFPSEKEEDFELLLDFVRQAEFDHLGVFEYSHEEGTSAFDNFEDIIPPEVKAERKAKIMELQQEISLQKNLRLVGKVVPVLIEGMHPDSDLLLAGRMQSQAPEVDGAVIINDGFANPGDIVDVTIEEAHPYDLIGHINAK